MTFDASVPPEYVRTVTVRCLASCQAIRSCLQPREHRGSAATSPTEIPTRLQILRLEQRGVTELEVRAMLENDTSFEPNVAEGRFTIHVGHLQHPWIVIVEPDADAKLLVVVTVYEVSE